MSDQTTAELIIEELRRQVDHQISAADAIDTKAMAIFAGAAGVAAFIAPRVDVSDGLKILAAVITLGVLIASLVSLLFAVRPRIGGFSNGPNASQVAERLQDTPDSLRNELVPSFVGVRDRNEAFLAAKADWIIRALQGLLATVVGIGAMVGVGAIK